VTRDRASYDAFAVADGRGFAASWRRLPPSEGNADYSGSTLSQRWSVLKSIPSFSAVCTLRPPSCS